MDKHEFTKKWEASSGLHLIGEERLTFLKECSLILYLDDDILEMALKVASQKHNFNLQYIETVGLHLRQYLNRLSYETIQGDAEVPARRSQAKKHLTLIHGGENLR